jgi:hypothetical protein
MSVVSETVRASVIARAEQRCEYCHLPMRGQVATFPVDHVTPRSNAGTTTLDNLALACPHCNGCRWRHEDGLDVVSGESARLFNPRLDSWADHFEWSKAQEGVLLVKTVIGRATISRLQINAADMLALRQLLAALGLFVEVNK